MLFCAGLVLLGCTQAALPTFPAHELLLLLLGVSSIKRRPPPGWLRAAFEQLQPSLPAMSPAQLSTAALAFGRLNYVPSTAWMTQFWQAWESQQVVFSARGHATVMWGVGTIQPVKPDPQQWARQLQGALQVAVARATKAVAAVALQKIQLAAKKQELIQQEQLELEQQPVSIVTEQLDGNVAQQSVLQQQALAVVQEQQQVLSQQEDSEPLGEEGLELLLLQQGQQQDISEQPQLLGSASLLHPTDCAMVMYGLARLGHSCIDPSFPAFWLAQSRSQLGNMNSQELAMSLWALGKLRLLPPEVWLQQALQCTARAARSMNHRQLAMVWWGCARLRVRRSREAGDDKCGRRGGVCGIGNMAGGVADTGADTLVSTAGCMSACMPYLAHAGGAIYLHAFMHSRPTA